MIIVLASLALLSFILIIYNRSLLAPVIVASAIIGCGPGLDGKFIFDEALIGAAAFAAILVDWRHLRKNIETVVRSLALPDYIFLGLLMYILAQTLRTFLNTGYSGVIDHAVHTIFIFVVYLMLKHEHASDVFRRPIKIVGANRTYEIGWVAFVSTMVVGLNIAYFAQGALVEIISIFLDANFDPLIRYSTQGSIWSGSVYAVLPNLLFFLVYKKVISDNPIISAIWLISLGAIAVYYDSRVALAIFLISIVFATFSWFKSYKAILQTLLIALILGAFSLAVSDGLRRTFLTSVSGLAFLISPRIEETYKSGDYDRYAHFYGALRAIDDGISEAVFGYGTRMHRMLIGKHIVEIIIDLGLKEFLDEQRNGDASKTVGNAPTTRLDMQQMLSHGSRTTTFSSVLIDYGLLGLVALFAGIPIAIISAVGKRDFRSIGRIENIPVFVWGASVILVSTVSYMAENTFYWFLLMAFLTRQLIFVEKIKK